MRTRSKTTFLQVEYDAPVGRGEYPSAGGGALESTSNDELISLYYTPKAPTKSNTDLTLVDTMSDTVIPGFSRRVKAGEILPTNPMAKQSVIHAENAPQLTSIACAFLEGPLRESPYGHGKTREFSISTSYVIAPSSVTPRNILTNRDIQAVQVAALAKLRSQGMDMLTTAAEFRQTLAMITGARRKLEQMISQAAKLFRRKHRNMWSWNEFVNELVSSPWLEARFGWRILYYDLLAIQEYLDTMDESKKFIVGRASASRSLTETRNNVTYHYTDEVKVGYPGTRNMSVPGFASLPNTVWEVIPFSLVVDMFFDVQSRILAYSGAAVNVEEHHAAAFVTRKRRVVAIAQAEMPKPSQRLPKLTVLHRPSAIMVYGSDQTRSPTTVPPLGLPSFKLNLGGYKPIDLAFLTRIIISKMF